jgi:hypothetical protein
MWRRLKPAPVLELSNDNLSAADIMRLRLNWITKLLERLAECHILHLALKAPKRSSRASRISKRGGRFGPARAPFPEPQKPATEHVRLQAVICRCCTSAWANLIALRSPHALQV